ncbi:MAG: hemerythrin domain-containing protein [Sphingomicrobium sp.]
MASTDIFERLKKDHDKHRRLIAAIEGTVGESDERKALFDEYKTDATAHAATEELTLYAALMGEVEMRVFAQHSAADHHKIEKLFDALAKADMSSSGWLNQFASLKKEYLEHLQEEEETIFPRALKDLGKERAVELRDEFNRQKPEEIERVESGADEKLNKLLD